MTKDEAFLAKLAQVGPDVTIFAGALLLRPELISVGEGSRIDDFTRIEGGQGVEIGAYVHVSSFCSTFRNRVPMPSCWPRPATGHAQSGRTRSG